MLHFTAAQLRDHVIKDDFGQPISLSSRRAQNSSDTAGLHLYTVPRGMVALVHSIATQGGSNKAGATATINPSPSSSVAGIVITNEEEEAWGVSNFLSYLRRETFFMGTSTPTARSAPPGNVGLWQPKHPIAIPGGCVIDHNGTLGEFGNHAEIEMVLVPEGHARSLGYNVNTDPDKSRTRLLGLTVTSAEQDLVAGRAGKHIRTLDFNIRLQPASAGTNVLRIYQDDGGTERNIAIFINESPVDTLSIQFSPDDVFLKAGATLKAVTTIANSATVNVYAEYCDPSEVDSGVFWACVQPSKPGTGATAVPTAAGNIYKIQPEVELYYPKLDTTKTSPGRGHQHLVHGVGISVQKTAGVYNASLGTLVTEQTLFALSHGATSGEIDLNGVPTAPEVQTNQQLTPTLYATEHHQNVLYLNDRKNAACKPDDGSIWINALGLGPGTGVISAFVTATDDNNISAWAFFLWGRTIPVRFRNPVLNDG